MLARGLSRKKKLSFNSSINSFVNRSFSSNVQRDPFGLSDKAYNNAQNVLPKVGRNLHLTKNHPLSIIKTKIEEYFHDNFRRNNTSIFKCYDDIHPIVSTERCFDMLLVPKDHISRNPSDTYYIDRHTVLRPHTSAHQTELIEKGEHSFLVTGDVYRRDSIDRTHYPVFHQMEGVRIFDHEEYKQLKKPEEAYSEFVERDLKETLEGMVDKLFGKVEKRWVEAYFPFTEPSFELEIFFEEEWMEVLGCGVVHKDIMRNCQLGHLEGWAFGLGLERLAMILFDIPDIRLFWTQDERFLKQFESGEIVKFQPYSKFPPCLKDISFWITEDFKDNDFFELARREAGDLIESVELVDDFTHPKTNRRSKCFRITYRHMDRNLTNEEIDKLQFQLRDRTEEELDVELR